MNTIDYDNRYSGKFLDVIEGRDYLYSDGFVGNCIACNKLTRWKDFLSEQFICSQKCNDELYRKLKESGVIG